MASLSLIVLPEEAGKSSSSSFSSRTLLAILQAGWPAMLAGGSPVCKEEV